MANNTPIIGSLIDTLKNYFDRYSLLKNQSKFYNENRKTVDLTKIMTNEDISRALESKVDSVNSQSSTLYEKFFDLSLGRDGRYKEYEQIVYRLPECAQAIQVYVDSILAPDPGETNKALIIDTLKETDEAQQAKSVLEILLKKTNFERLLPQIVYTTLVYGDSFLELDPTSDGIRFIIHHPENCSIIYDAKTDIEIGLLIQTTEGESSLKTMLAEAYPEVILDVPQRVVSIVSNKTILANTKNEKFIYREIEKQLEELLEDIYKEEGCKYRYLPPHRYIRFPIFYNNNYYPYGTSLLDSVRSPAKQALLVDAALAIYRATRTPLRSMWTIEVGNLPQDQIQMLVRGVMDKARRQKVVENAGDDNGNNLSIDSIPEILGEQDDIWTVSKEGNKQLTYENLDSPDITPYTNDADYFRKKIISGLGIPPSYLGEESGSTRALLTLEDMRFSRTIKRYQQDFNNGLQELVNLCFTLINKLEFIDTVSLTLPPLLSIEANMRCENLDKRLQTAENMLNQFPNIPKYWILKNIVGFTDEELDSMEESVEVQKNMLIFSDQQIGEEEESGGGVHTSSGGHFGGGSRLGAEDFGEEPSFDLGGSETSETTETSETNAGNEAIDSEMSELNV